MKTGQIVAVGVGPGDPELLTVKAIRALQEADVIFAPTPNSTGQSLALNIIKTVLEGRGSAPEIITLLFPMIKDEAELERAWTENTDRIAKCAQEGKMVAYISVGDPSLYSTFTHILRHLGTRYPEIRVEIIPGITSLSACVARARMPLATGEETLLVLPGFDVKLLEKQGRLVDNIAWMKGVKNLPEMIKLLKDSGGFSEKSQLLIAKRCSLHDEELWKGEIQNALDLKFPEDYFATIMVRRRPSDA